MVSKEDGRLGMAVGVERLNRADVVIPAVGISRTRADASCASLVDISTAFTHHLLAMVAPPRTSAAGVLALLSEPDPQVQQYALRSLNSLVPQFWAEISEYIPPMQVFVAQRARRITNL